MWKYIVTPIIGAIIGYVTNWIAVKMLFRPRKEVRVFGKRLPFTPGVIPRGQARLAKAVGNVVETQLLTPEYMGEKLLSEESEKEFKSHIQAWVEEQKQSEDTLHSAAVKIVEEEKVDDFAASVEEDLTDFLSEKVIAMEPGKLIVDKVVQEAQRKLADSMFGMMLGGSFIEKIAGQIQEGIDAYIAENARGYIEKEVVAASEELQAKPIPEVTGFFEEKGISYLFIAHDLSMVRYVSDDVGVMYLGQLVEVCEADEIYSHPLHPYTKGLLGSIPIANPRLAREKEKSSIEGDIPSPINPPSGCRFHTRCPYATEKCKRVVPTFKEYEKGHWVACHLLEQ